MWLCFVPLAAPVGAAEPADSARAASHSHRLLWGAAAVTALGAAAALDRHIEEETDESNSGFERHLARAAQPFGNAVVVGSGLVLTYGAAHLLERPSLVRSTVRIGVSDVTAGLAAILIKRLAGRKRPEDAPGDPWQFRPFSNDASFPSGHTTVAFSTAVAIDDETSAHWVPWVVYPVATLVGWSRIHDDEHWTSDVVGGAALGAWSATMVEGHFRRHGLGWFEHVCWTVEPDRRGLGVELITKLGGP